MVSDTISSLRDRIDFDQFPVPDVLVLSLSALLWLVLLEGWLPDIGSAPAGLEASMSAPGVPEAMATTNGLPGVAAYLLVWGTMMLAMMLPSLLPVVRKHRREVCDSPSTFVPSIAAFLGGYALAWTAVGAVPLAVDYLVSIHDVATTAVFGIDAGAFLVGGLFAFAAGYQLSPFKRQLLERCSTSCRSIPHCPNCGRMARDGLEYAVNCIGCTWPLFALMVALGSMNFLVMVGLTLVVSLERLTPDGERVAVAWGVVLFGGAVFTLLFGVPSV